MISLQLGEDMVEHNQILIGAIRKLAPSGEQAWFTVEEMIELLKTGVSVETLLDLVSCAYIHIDLVKELGESVARELQRHAGHAPPDPLFAAGHKA